MTNEQIDLVRLHQQMTVIREMMFFAAQCPQAVPYMQCLGHMRMIAEEVMTRLETRIVSDRDQTRQEVECDPCQWEPHTRTVPTESTPAALGEETQSEFDFFFGKPGER